MEPEKQSEQAPPEPQRGVCLGRVQLKIVEARLTVRRDFGRDWEMTSEAIDRHCSVRFNNGQCSALQYKVAISVSLVSLAVPHFPPLHLLPSLLVASLLLTTSGSEKVYEVKIRSLSHVYQADSTVVLLRTSEGSAVVALPCVRGEVVEWAEEQERGGFVVRCRTPAITQAHRPPPSQTLVNC